MPTYPSPVDLLSFQTYLNDTSTDPTVTGFYQGLLATATEYVYTWLDRDYTPLAAKTDTFFGDDSQFYAPRYPIGLLNSWHAIDAAGIDHDQGVLDLIVRRRGTLLQTRTLRFDARSEHRLAYILPPDIFCPETVKLVITEIAALLFEASNQGMSTLGLLSATSRDGSSGGSLDRERFLDLTERHKEMLRPYKRYPI